MRSAKWATRKQRRRTLAPGSAELFESAGVFYVKWVELATVHAGCMTQNDHCDVCREHSTLYEDMTKSLLSWVQQELRKEHKNHPDLKRKRLPPHNREDLFLRFYNKHSNEVILRPISSSDTPTNLTLKSFIFLSIRRRLRSTSKSKIAALSRSKYHLDTIWSSQRRSFTRVARNCNQIASTYSARERS